ERSACDGGVRPDRYTGWWRQHLACANGYECYSKLAGWVGGLDCIRLADRGIGVFDPAGGRLDDDIAFAIPVYANRAGGMADPVPGTADKARSLPADSARGLTTHPHADRHRMVAARGADSAQCHEWSRARSCRRLIGT